MVPRGLSPRTEHDYRQVIARWQRLERPEPQTWVAAQPSEARRRNVRAALVWWYRVELGRTLDLPVIPATRRVPTAYTEAQLESILQAARATHRRASPTFGLLYSTGARLGEAVGIALEDVTSTHVILRETKRNAATGNRVERAIPLSTRSRAAVEELRALPPGKKNNLLGVARHTVQDWGRVLTYGLGFHVYAHKVRATFCTHLLQRGVPPHEVQRLMGHGDITTTMRYAAVTDERLAMAVELL